MSKAILVMDMPESCAKCDFFGNNIHNKPICICQTEKIVERMCTKDAYKRISVNAMTEKPDWCPLRPMPENKKISRYMNETEKGRCDGWNDCIDAMEGGVNKNEV